MEILLIQSALEADREMGIVKKEERIVITAGVPSGIPGTTNLVNVEVA